MYSKSFRFLNALSVPSPILLSLWAVTTIQNWSSLHFYFPKTILGSGKEFFKAHWALFGFACFCCVIYYNINLAITQLPHRPFVMKKSKSVDYNFISIVVSCLLPFTKFLWKDANDTIYLCAVLAIWVILSFISMNGYQFNIIVRVSGYRYYEVENIDDISFLALSKRKIISKSDMKAYVSLTDHMIVNV